MQVNNPYLGNTGPLGGSKDVFRYEFVNDSDDGGGVDAAPDGQSINNFLGFRVTNSERVGAGIGPATTSLDPYYDAANDSWLIGTIEYDVVRIGSTELWLQIGSAGLLNIDETSSATEVVFGALTDTSLNGSTGREIDSDTADASIAVPEPSTLALVACGLFGVLVPHRHRASH